MTKTNTTFKINVVAPGAGPAWLAGAAPMSWIQVPNSAPSTSSVLPSPPAEGVVSSVTDAWGGATVRQSSGHFILHGGGHGDYSGNEIYALPLLDDAPAWTRPWGPTPAAQVTRDTMYYLDGNPASAHTYYNMQYDAVADRVLRMDGGWWAGTSGMSGKFNSWDWGAANWNPDGTHPGLPYNAPDQSVAVHPVTGDVYIWVTSAQMIWRRATNTFTSMNTSALQILGDAMVLDVANNCCWGFGGWGSYPTYGKVHKWDLSDNTTTSVSVTGSALALTTRQSLGAAIDPDTGLIYVCTPDGSVHVFDPNALTLNDVTLMGTGPQSTTAYGNSNGLYSRFQYINALKAFVVLPAWAAPMFAFKP